MTTPASESAAEVAAVAVLEAERPSGVTARVIATAAVGVGAGVAGMAASMLLHWVQHLAYGYSLDHVISGASFLSGVTNATPARRVVVMVLCGIVAGCGWWALYRWGRRPVSVKRSIAPDGERMPPLTTVCHAVLQLTTVGMGSPLGREVAPRELGAILGHQISVWTRLSARDRSMMVACGAGAGLAAVYNVPLAGAVFTLELLTGTFTWSALLPAMATSAIAAVVAWIGLGDEIQYSIPAFALSTPLIVWSIVAGPVFGLAGFGFHALTKRAREAAPRDWRLIPLTLANFTAIGLVAIWYPQVLGNGRGPAGLSFGDSLTLGLAATLLVLKLIVIATTLRSGAQGGLLTPSLTAGALLGLVMGGLWNLVWPGTELGAFAVVGAAALLGSAVKMPLTAVVLMMEFTRVGHDFLIPMMLCLAGAATMFWVCEREEELGAAAAWWTRAVGAFGRSARPR